MHDYDSVSFFFFGGTSFALVDPRFNIGIFLKFLGADIE